jgi:hypothetical protein
VVNAIHAIDTSLQSTISQNTERMVTSASNNQAALGDAVRAAAARLSQTMQENERGLGESLERTASAAADRIHADLHRLGELQESGNEHLELQNGQLAKLASLVADVRDESRAEHRATDGGHPAEPPAPRTADGEKNAATPGPRTDSSDPSPKPSSNPKPPPTDDARVGVLLVLLGLILLGGFLGGLANWLVERTVVIRTNTDGLTKRPWWSRVAIGCAAAAAGAFIALGHPLDLSVVNGNVVNVNDAFRLTGFSVLCAFIGEPLLNTLSLFVKFAARKSVRPNEPAPPTPKRGPKNARIGAVMEAGTPEELFHRHKESSLVEVLDRYGSPTEFCVKGNRTFEVQYFNDECGRRFGFHNGHLIYVQSVE